MTIETACPDCRGRGHFTVIKGDVLEGYEKCLRCNKYGWTLVEIPEDEVYDIIKALVEQKHELISKYL